MILEIENPAPFGAIFDSHAHYDDSKFDEILDDLLKSLPEYGVGGVINCATNFESCEKTIKLCEAYDYIYGAVGFHPLDIPETGELDKNRLDLYAKHSKVVAIGEIGLDYHYTPETKLTQQKWFEEQIVLAKELDLPVVVHDREAHADVLNLLKKHRPRGVVHCFSGSVEMAEEIMKLGMYIGLGGAVTFHNAKKPVQVAAAIPLDRLLLETDAPYMTPVPHRGKTCHSAHIAYTAQRIAEIRGTGRGEILKASKQNVVDLFKIK